MEDKDYTCLAVKLEGVDARCRSNEHRIDDCEAELKEIKNEQKAIYIISTSVEKLATSMGGLQTDVKEIKEGQETLNSKVCDLENRPAKETKKRFDNMTDKIMWLILSGVVGFILAQLLPNIF